MLFAADYSTCVQSKLVAVMRERLSRALHYFPEVSAAWGRFPKPSSRGGEGALPPPFSSEPRVPICELIGQLIQQLTTLKNVLAPLLADAQLQDVFGRIARMYSDSLARYASASGVLLFSKIGYFHPGIIISRY